MEALPGTAESLGKGSERARGSLRSWITKHAGLWQFACAQCGVLGAIRQPMHGQSCLVVLVVTAGKRPLLRVGAAQQTRHTRIIGCVGL
jgi:hypothetical protein